MLQMFDDSEFGELSRKASDNYELPKPTDTWGALQQKLDVYLPQKKDKRRGFVFWWFGLLLLGLASWGIVTTINGSAKKKDTLANTKTITAKNNSHLDIQPKAAQTVEAEIQGTGADIADKLKDSAEATTKEKALVVNKLAADDANKNISVNNKIVIAAENDKSNIITNNKKKLVLKQKAINKQLAATSFTTNELSVNNNVRGINKSAGSNSIIEESLVAPKSVNNENVSNPVKENSAIPKEDTVVAKEPATVKSEAAVESGNNQQKKTSGQSLSKFEFGLLVGTDLSTVKFYNIDKPGFSIGGTVGYNINNRWAIQTGYIYTQKNYTAKGEDFKSRYSNAYWKLEEAKGVCYMWELPVNIRYNIKTTKQSNLFIAAGLSSYFMKKENYSYTSDSSGVYRERYVTYNKNSDYWLSILNFGMGYQKNLNNNFSVAVEPFFKMPLKGVGWGSVSLNSMGIYFSVKYRPVIAKRKK